jgi:hypothetical protein
MNRFFFAVFVLAVVGCKPPESETDKPPVNTPRPPAIVKQTNNVGVPLTNVPVTHSATNK